MGALRERMIREMQLRRFAPGTQRIYAAAVAGLVRHVNRLPEEIGSEDVKDYLLHLMNDRGRAWSTVNVVCAAVRFFYNEVLGRADVSRAIPPRRTPRQLPEVLSAEEIERLFAATSNLKHRTLFMTAYAARLRVSELVRLKVTDIDSSRMMIRVDRGKGEKDRYTVLSQRLLGELRVCWKKTCRPSEWLFPGAGRHRPMSRHSAAQAYPRECTETFQDGHVRAFDFFQGAPRRISYDNARTSVSGIIGSRTRRLTDGFLQPQSHYLFEEHFCRARRANEKGVVEGVVKYARLNYFVPVPAVKDFEELNAHLEQRCREDLDRKLPG